MEDCCDREAGSPASAHSPSRIVNLGNDDEVSRNIAVLIDRLYPLTGLWIVQTPFPILYSPGRQIRGQ